MINYCTDGLFLVGCDIRRKTKWYIKILILLFMCKQYVKCWLKEIHITEESIITMMLLNYKMVDILLAYFMENSESVTEKLCEK